MAVKKQNTYIHADLDWAEQKLHEWREYVDANPISQITDRWGKKEMPRGGHTWVVTATIEQQIKSIQDTMTRYLQLLEVVDNLREKEAKRLETRGDAEINGMMSNMMKR